MQWLSFLELKTRILDFSVLTVKPSQSSLCLCHHHIELECLQHVVWHFDFGQMSRSSFLSDHHFWWCPESPPLNTVINFCEVHESCVEFAAVVGSPGLTIRGKVSKDKHLRGWRKCGCLRTPSGCGPTLLGWGALPPLGSYQPTPALWDLFLLRVLVLVLSVFLFSLCSRTLLCIRILCRCWTAMRWRSLQTLLAAGLGSLRPLRGLRVWSVKMVPAVPTRMGQMSTSHIRVWLR